MPCKSIPSNHIPFEPHHSIPEWVELISRYSFTGELGIWQLQLAEQPPHHHYKYLLGKGFLGVSTQRLFKLLQVLVHLPEISEPNQCTCVFVEYEGLFDMHFIHNE